MTDRYDDKKTSRRASDLNNNRRSRNTQNHLRNDQRYDKDNKISWGAIIAGAISFAAVFTVLNLLVAALGLGIFSPNNQNPLSSMGVGVAIATVIILVISFVVSGFIAGAFSKGQSLLHGFMSWALSILLMFSLVTTIIAQALGLAGQAAGTVASTAGDVAGSAVSTAGDATDNALSSVADSITGVDTNKLEEDINNALSETDVKELQPGYLKGALDESKDEILTAGRELLTNPENKDEILSNLSTSLEERAQNITDSVDKETIQEEVYKNSDLTAAESEEAVDNIYNGLDEASKEASKQINNSKDALDKTSTEVDKTVEDVKDGAESATNKASFGAVLVFIFLILGLGIEIYAAKQGEQYVNNY